MSKSNQMFKLHTSKKAEFTWEQIIYIILALALLIWVLFFSGSLGDAIKESAAKLARLFR